MKIGILNTGNVGSQHGEDRKLDPLLAELAGRVSWDDQAGGGVR